MMMMIIINLFVFSFVSIIPRWKVDDEEDGGPSAPPVEDDDGEHHDVDVDEDEDRDGMLVYLR